MTNKLWELQNFINQTNNDRMGILARQIELLASIIEDHEKEIEKMSAEINELKRQLSTRA